MLRLRQAEKTILAEEAIQGQYLRDHNDRLVPAWQAERERFAETVAVDDNRPLSQQARIPEPAFAPFAEQSGFGLDPMQPGDESTTFVSSDDTASMARGRNKQQRSKRRAGEKVQPPPGKARASKIGGELHTLTTAGTSGRKKAPSRRSRGAILDMDITRKEKENQELENQLMTLKSDLKIAQGALGDMEREVDSVVFEDDEMKEKAATIIQSEIRQVEAKTKVDTIRKKKEQVEAAQQLVLMREKELAVKKRELAEKMKQREDFKKVEKRSQDARRAR
jgi:hypothetical protein